MFSEGFKPPTRIHVVLFCRWWLICWWVKPPFSPRNAAVLCFRWWLIFFWLPIPSWKRGLLEPRGFPGRPVLDADFLLSNSRGSAIPVTKSGTLAADLSGKSRAIDTGSSWVGCCFVYIYICLFTYLHLFIYIYSIYIPYVYILYMYKCIYIYI